MDNQLVGTSRDFKPRGFSKIIDLRQVGKAHCARFFFFLVKVNLSTKENDLGNLHCLIQTQSRVSLPLKGI